MAWPSAMLERLSVGRSVEDIDASPFVMWFILDLPV